MALRLAKTARRNPREIAQAIVAALPASDLIAKAEVAGAGFINFHLAADAYARELERIMAEGARYGCSNVGAGTRVLVEFVSSNPTGPLHVGHGRHAAYGATLANLLAATGFDVQPRVLRERCRAPDGYPGGERVAALPGAVRRALRVPEQRLSR